MKQVAEAFGRMGIESVQIGQRVIHSIPPAEVEEVVGAGDTFRKGDVVLKEGDVYPQRVIAILPPTEPGLGPSLLLRMVDEGPEAEKSRGPHCCLAWNDQLGWRNNYQKLTQADLDKWFHETKKLRPEGWHVLPLTARFRIAAGIPAEIERKLDRKHTQDYLAEEVGRLTGYDIILNRRYIDRMKRRTLVLRAVRRLPPVI